MTVKPPLLLLLVSGFLVASGVAAQPFERILIPTVAADPIPGAYGSQWVTEVAGRNTGSGGARLFFPVCGNLTCVYRELEPNSSFGVAVLPTRLSPHGTVLTLWRDQAARMIVSVRARDLSRNLDTWGTDIPTVRESEVGSNPISLLNLPNNERFRLTLRMYDFGWVDNSFVVSVLPLVGDNLVAEFVVPTEFLMDAHGVNQGIRFAVMTELRLPASAPDRLRLVIRTQLPTQYWAFAAVTNNETQHVTVVAPAREGKVP